MVILLFKGVAFKDSDLISKKL